MLEFKQASTSAISVRAEAAKLACVKLSLESRLTASFSFSEKPGKPMFIIDTPNSSSALASLTLSE
jgi:hypothetical protein